MLTQAQERASRCLGRKGAKCHTCAYTRATRTHTHTQGRAFKRGNGERDREGQAGKQHLGAIGGEKEGSEREKYGGQRGISSGPRWMAWG